MSEAAIAASPCEALNEQQRNETANENDARTVYASDCLACFQPYANKHFASSFHRVIGGVAI